MNCISQILCMCFLSHNGNSAYMLVWNVSFMKNYEFKIISAE